MITSPARILWPTDFSAHSLRGGRYARGLAALFGAELHILHTVPPPLAPDATLLMPADIPAPCSEADLLNASKKAMDELVRKHFADVPRVVTSVGFGNPWPSICNYAKDKEIQLIVVTTHGRTGLGHVLIGSTAERIVQHAPCPVLVVKEQECGFLAEP